MRIAFFHDHRFGRDAAGVHYSNGALPYRAFRRYLNHFDDVVVVGRVEPWGARTPTLASGPGVTMACIEPTSRLAFYLGDAVRRHVRGVLAEVDCALIRLPSFIGRIACREAIRARKPWMVEVVGSAFDALWHHGSVAGKVIALASDVMTRRCVASAPFALYVSQQFLQSRYPCRGETVGCSNVAIDAPQSTVLELRLARIRGRPATAPLALGVVGSLDVAYKGHDVALRALARLRHTTPQLTLRCLGGGDPSRWRRRSTELGVAHRVEFSGTLPHGAPVLEWMDQLDLFLVPSLSEGIPRCLVEAMSRALPAIGSRCGGIPELLPDDCTHRPGDADALAALIHRFAASPEEMARHAQRNWELATEYAADVLEERRSRFLARFKAFAAAHGHRSSGDRANARETLSG
jgi:glycosyltransferase involved in cell wall biosynthesis